MALKFTKPDLSKEHALSGIEDIKAGKVQPNQVKGNKLNRSFINEDNRDVVSEEALKQKKSLAIKQKRKTNATSPINLSLDPEAKVKNPIVPILIDFLNERGKEGYTINDFLTLQEKYSNVKKSVGRTRLNHLTSKAEISYARFVEAVTCFGYNINIDLTRNEDKIKNLEVKPSVAVKDEVDKDLSKPIEATDVSKYYEPEPDID